MFGTVNLFPAVFDKAGVHLSDPSYYKEHYLDYIMPKVVELMGH